jgi:peptide-methionine (S)-S-oxide reductase
VDFSSMRILRLQHRSIAWLALAGAVLGACGTGPTAVPRQALPAVPAPGLDSPRAEGPIQTAILAGGCFWGVEAVFEHVLGVVEVRSGYSGGTAASARYEAVLTGTTGHAEAVEIRFDPGLITYGQILHIFFATAHDPTQVDRQGPDVGPHYRSHIYFADEGQRRIARAYLDQLTAERIFRGPIATRLDPLDGFYPAEIEHQNYVLNNPSDPYVTEYDLPKLYLLQVLFPELFEPPAIGLPGRRP